MRISIIACIAQDGAIGNKGKLLYHLPDDLHHFRDLTMGHIIIMGRKTYDSLPHGALPHRRNMVISKKGRTALQKEALPDLRYHDCEIYSSLEEALAACQTSPEVFIIGGESLYRQALPLATVLQLTLVEDTPQEADAFFPLTAEDIKKMVGKEWRLVSTSTHCLHSLTYHFLELRRED